MNVMDEVDVITQEQVEEHVKAEREANLVAEGTFEGILISWSKIEEHEKGEKSLFHGVPQYRAGIIFYDCPNEGKKKSQFFNFTPHKLLGDGGRPKLAYSTLVQMVKALNMQGQPIPDVFEQAKVTRLKYRVAQFTPEGGDTLNYLKAISAA